MSRRNTILAAGLGVAVGLLVSNKLINSSQLSPEQALNTAKKFLQKNGPINGSWIYMNPENFEQSNLVYDTYRGGFTRSIDGNEQQFEFHVDRDTGAVVNVAESAL